MMPGAAPQPPNVPDWSMAKPLEVPEGIIPPAAGLQVRGLITNPDASGHRWVMLEIGDLTVTVTFRMPWQNAAFLGAAIANILGQVSAMAEQQSGPQLVVPPPGTKIPDLGINGHRSNGGRP